jgi:hypothetical protein
LIEAMPYFFILPAVVRFSYARRALVGVVGCLACGSRAVIDGKLMASDGRRRDARAVELHYEVGDLGRRPAMS